MALDTSEVVWLSLPLICFKVPAKACLKTYIKVPRSGRLHLRNLFLLTEGVRSRKLSDHRIEKGDRRELLSDARQPEVDIPEQWLRPNFQLNRLNNS